VRSVNVLEWLPERLTIRAILDDLAAIRVNASS